MRLADNIGQYVVHGTTTGSFNRQSSSTPRLITITIEAPQSFDHRNGGYYNFTKTVVEIPAAHGPALRSALDELKSSIGGKLEKPSTYAREAALTRASNAVGKLFAAVCKSVPKYDTDYTLISNN